MRARVMPITVFVDVGRGPIKLLTMRKLVDMGSTRNLAARASSDTIGRPQLGSTLIELHAALIVQSAAKGFFDRKMAAKKKTQRVPRKAETADLTPAQALPAHRLRVQDADLEA